MTNGIIKKVGFVGTGTMGAPMTRNLMKAGFEAYVYNRTQEKAQPLVEEGATLCATPAEVGKQAECVMLCVSDAPDVEEVVMGENGIASDMPEGGIIIDHSTSAFKLAEEMAAKLKERGIGILDAPISGGPEGAKAGSLSIMVGGEEEVYQQALPVLEAMGKTITHIGPPGAGQLTKAVNQIVIATSLVGIAEGIIMARKSGINPERVLQAISGGAARSFMMDKRGPLMVNEDFEKAFFALGYHAKDLRMAMQIAQNVGAKIPLSEMANQHFQDLDQESKGKLDHSAVYLWTKKENQL